ncbi:MAG: hypothetical protein ACFFCW_46190 [Candidatus Hodarchaeota archaeon]
MADELAEVIKKYVKEAIHECFRDMWREFEGEELPYPPPPMWFHLSYLPRYRDLYDRFDRDVESLSHSVQFLRDLAIKAQDWDAECSEKEKIEKLTEDVGEIRETMSEIPDLLKQIASK